MGARLFLISVLAFLYAGVAFAGCARHSAPGVFQNPKNAWNGTDTGVVVDGFVDLASPAGPTFMVSHGADFSRHNIVTHSTIKDCGGEFTFLRVDDKFADHREAAQSAGLIAIPYYFFGVGDARRKTAQYGKDNEAQIKARLADFGAVGRNAGTKFVEKIGTLYPAGIPVSTIAGMTGQLVALDVEEKLKDEAGSNPLQRAYYGRYYAHAVCSWVKEVRQTYKQLIPIIYTTPSVYADYLDKAFADDYACLQGFPIWVARTTVDGGDVIRSSNSTIDKFAQRLCLVSGGNRCIIHQYSHRGVFAARPPGRTPPSHIDLDRWFNVQMVDTAAGTQIVRSSATK